MDKVLILYERKNRELENCIILKAALERLGYCVLISHFLDPRNFDWFLNKSYKYVFVPHLYNDESCYRNLYRFGSSKYVINMQYEQVLSDKWEALGHHNPKGLAINGIHVCWGLLTRERLLLAGVPPNCCPVLGAVQLDMLRPEYRTHGETLKKYYSNKFNLPLERKWILFLSSFTYADISEQRLKINENVAGIPLDDIVPYYTNSRNILIDWFDEYLKINKDVIFIYRPHPDELNIDSVKKLSIKYDNFFIIGDGAAKQWIEASDINFTWYSTTVVESQFLEKSSYILRPIDLPDDFDSVLLKRGAFIKDAKTFCQIKSDNTVNKPIPDEFINGYYLKSDEPAFVNIINYLDSATFEFPKLKFNIGFFCKNRLKMFVILFLYLIYKSRIINIKGKTLGDNHNFITQWLLEMDNQFHTHCEYNNIFGTINSKLQ